MPTVCVDLTAALEALEEENESESDLMEYLVDGLGYLLKMYRAGKPLMSWDCTLFATFRVTVFVAA